jgi:serine/threonine protein kinase
MAVVRIVSVAPVDINPANQRVFNEKIDIWSLGCILFSLIIGKNLFLNKSKVDVSKQDEFKKYIIKQHQNLKFHLKKIDKNVLIRASACSFWYPMYITSECYKILYDLKYDV